MILYTVRNRWDDRFLCAANLTWVNDGRASCFFTTPEKAENAKEAYLSQHGDDRERVYVDDYEYEPEYYAALTKPDSTPLFERDDLETLIKDLHAHYENIAGENGESDYAQQAYIYTAIEGQLVLLSEVEVEGQVDSGPSDYDQHNIWNKTQLGVK